MRNKLKRVLSLVMVFCMVCSLMFVNSGNVYATDGTDAATTATDDDTSASSYEYSIVHLDNGRKYYSVDSIKTIIDNAAAAGFNYIELAVGNDGMRFLLDDMSLSFTVDGTEYSYTSEQVSSAIHTGNEAYYNETTDELTESEMDEIISYAAENGMGIIPLINTPGHMDAILDAGEALTETTLSYNGSGRTIDVTNDTAVAFTQALLNKYIAYFAGKGCTVFNMGADEYANDKYTSGSMGFGALQSAGQYTYYVEYVNEVAALIKDAGMTPMAFNDGIYFNNNTSSGTFDTDIMIAYWSSGWSGYTVASASTLADKGFKMINTHGDYYWIVGGSQCTASTAADFNYKTFQGGTISDPAGAMFCIWSDYPGALTDTQVASQTASVIAAFGATLPETSSVEITEDESITDESTDVTVTASGLTSATIEKVASPSEEGALAYNIVLTTAESDSYTGSATVTIPIPEDWNTGLVRGYVAGSDAGEAVDGITGTVSTKEGTNYFTFTAPHFSEVGIYQISENADSDETEVTNEETITVSVGGTATATISGANYAGTYSTEDSSIATVSVTGSNGQESSVTYTQASSVSVTSLLNSDTTNYTATSYYYTPDNGTNYYPLYVTRSSSFPNYTYTYYYYNGSSYQQIGTQTRSYFASETTYVNITLYTKTGTAAVEASTTVTFTGVAVGTTYVTVGNTRYTINVIAEDLSSVTGLTVEFWITNRQVTANGGISMTISASEAYGESGVLISSLVPSTGTQADSGTMAYWKTTRLTSNIKQTTTSGVDRTTSGDDFTYIRYYGGSWAFSSDGETWTTISSSDQIVAYYLMVTNVTTEITTEVVDWGTDRDSYNASNFVLVDYAVHYENGTVSPSTYPSFDTNAFHCDSGDTTTVHKDSTANKYYREIGMIQAVNSADYEVYMITLTPTSDNASTAVASTASAADSYTYDGTEKVVWVIDEETLATTAFADSSLWFTSISGEITLTVGGEAIVPGLEIYNQQGMLVTYYIRAKQTEDSLTVNYVDLTTNSQFYTYNIAVNSGTTFSTDPAIALDANGNVENGNVTNKQGVTQTVSSDLSTLAAVSALYKNSDYTCVKLELSEDGKTVTLYYTFNTTASFVVDFGLPVNITADDIVAGSTITAVNGSGATLSNGTITWQATSVMTGIQSFGATVSETENNTTVSHTYTVYMIPATTVYYEEGFATYGTGWSVTGTGSWSDTDDKGTVAQETHIANDTVNKYNNYGYDGAYDPNADGDTVAAKAASTANAGDSLTFTFKGTGVDIFANRTSSTGVVMIKIEDSAGSIEKMLTVDTIDAGDYDVDGSTAYNSPIASVSNLDYDSYTVTIYVVEDETFNFDGFRVYGTIDEESDTTTSAVYKNDLEDNPSYYELRNNVLTGLNVSTSSSDYAGQLSNTLAQVYASSESAGAIVVYSSDSGLLASGTTVQDLLDDGPKNELYLDSGASVVFKITTNREVQIGLRSVTGEEVTYTIDGTTYTTSSSVDMFYDLQAKRDSSTETTYTITVTSGGILSITDIKVSDCNDENIFGTLTADEVVAALTGETSEAEETVYADASLSVNLVDYTGSVIATTSLTENGVEGEDATFAAADILAAVSEALPSGYALVDEADIADAVVAYGENGSVDVQIGKVATLVVTYQKYTGIFKKTTVSTVTLTKVQTSSAGKATFTASEIKAAVPSGYKVLLATASSVSYGSTGTKTVTVY